MIAAMKTERLLSLDVRGGHRWAVLAMLYRRRIFVRI
jgi:hypothetical protein